MTVEFSEVGIAEQKKHKFAHHIHSFTRDPHQTPILIDRLEIHPASMASQRGIATPFPGNMIVAFVPESTPEGRMLVRKNLGESLPVTLDGYNNDPWFHVFPKSGVVTHQLVQQALTTLYKTEAIHENHVAAAATTFGIAKPHTSGIILDTPLTTKHYDPERPRVMRNIYALVYGAKLNRP